MPISGMTACLADKRMDMIGGAVIDLASSKVQCDPNSTQVGFEFGAARSRPPEIRPVELRGVHGFAYYRLADLQHRKGERARDDFDY